MHTALQTASMLGKGIGQVTIERKKERKKKERKIIRKKLKKERKKEDMIRFIVIVENNSQ